MREIKWEFEGLLVDFVKVSIPNSNVCAPLDSTVVLRLNVDI